MNETTNAMTNVMMACKIFLENCPSPINIASEANPGVAIANAFKTTTPA